MKKLNKQSELYYIEKMVAFRPLNVSKIYLIDDDCNEFIATVVGVEYSRGYINPSDVKIIDYEEYSNDKWCEMTNYIEYERAIVA